MLSSAKQKEPRKQKHKEKNVTAPNSKPTDTVKEKDSDFCEVEEARAVLGNESMVKENLVKENGEDTQAKCRTSVDKFIETSTLKKNGTINKEGNNLFFLEDGEAFDVLLLFETENDIKSSLYPDELVNCENVEPSMLKPQSYDCKRESKVFNSQLRSPNYVTLINEVQEITLSDESVEPSAPDFTSIGKESQETGKDLQCLWFYTDAAEEVKCAKDQIDIVELKPKMLRHNFKPFSEEELALFYYNSELNQVHDFITEFVKEETKLEARLTHPFYELLSKYLIAKNSLENSNHKLKSLDEKLDKHVSEIWTVFNDIEVHKIGKCTDGNSLNMKHKYMKAYFNEEAFGNFKSLLCEIRSVLFEIYKRDSFNCMRYKLKIELYIENLLTACKEFTSLNDSTPISIAHSSKDVYFQECIGNIKVAIGILFFFQRKQKTDVCPSFLEESRQWLTDLVSLLLRTGNWKDHLFILNHILRCPGGVGEWASCYVQFPAPGPCDPFSNPVINHIMASFSVLLQTVELRENFMNEWNVISGPDENSWVIIDSDDEGEEAESLSSPLKENDLVLLLNQIPLQNLFTAILGLNNGKLDPQILTINHLLKVFSFGLDLIKLLHAGLQVYSAQRYKQFVKRLGRLMSHIIEYVTDEVDLYFTRGTVRNIRDSERIQIEYDNFFLKSTKTIFSSRVHGTWQYLTVVPYYRASEFVILELYNAMQLSEADNSTINGINLVEFEEKFMKLPESEQLYLLSSFASMAMARSLSELDFIIAVVHQLLYIGFLSNFTKDHCYKTVKSLLFNLCSKFSFLISEILRIQNENFILKEGLDQGLTTYLWKELPLTAWKPTYEDLNIMSSWLLHPTQNIQSELARIILKSLHYGVEHGDLFLPLETHQMIAHIVMKVSNKLYKEQEMDVIKNVSSFVGFQELEPGLLSWIWNILLKLRLHLFDQAPASVKRTKNNMNDALKTVPELISNKQLHESVEQKNPVACFIALMTTTLGHSVPIIYNEGFALVDVLIRARKYEAAIACLEYITLMFVECPDSLYKCTYFSSIITQLINADNSYLKLTKNLKASKEPGPILLCFENMIQNQVGSWCDLGISRSTVIELWIKSLTKIPLWTQEPGVIYLVDSLCKLVYFDKITSLLVKDIFRNLLPEISSPAEPKSSLASLVNWMNYKTTIPTLLPRGYNGNAVWFFLMVMDIEKDINERSNSLWNELLKELQTCNDKKTNVDNCLKKACNNLKIPVRTSETLFIYRLCHQILETDITHPFTIVLWQHFFLLYFYRVPELADNGSVGEKFFHGILNQSLLKKMKHRLEETLNYYTALEESDKKVNHSSRCTYVLEVFKLWFDDPKLHEPHLNVRLLPPRYDPELLGTIIQQNDAVWIDIIDYVKIQNEINKNRLTWQEVKNRTTRYIASFRTSTVTSDRSLTDKIQENLMRYENPLPPPSINIKKCNIVLPLQNIGTSCRTIIPFLRPSFRILLDYADYYVQEMGEHAGLSCRLQDLIKKLYKIKQSSITLRETCNGYVRVINGKKTNFKCSGPATTTLSFEESIMNRKCNDIFNQVLRNFNRNLQRSLLPLHQNLGISVVSIEKVIEHLVSEYVFLKKHSGNKQIVKNLESTGISLYYDVLNSWSESVSATPSVAAIFEDCLNTLGNTFISENQTQQDRLIETINEHPKLVDKLQAHLNPNVCSAQNFIDLYCKARKSNSDIKFALISRFNLVKWLTERKPRFADISSLIHEIGFGLKSFGQETDGHMALIELFNSHLQHLLTHDFPEHYGEVLNLLLEGSETQTIPTSTWFTFINSIVPEGIVFKEGKCDSTSFEPGQSAKKLKYLFTQYATHQKILSLSNIRETITHLAGNFKTDRLKHGLYGLYPKYHPYVEPILIFCGMLSHAFVAETLKLDLGSLSSKITDQVWPHLKDLYSPWLVPYWSKQEKAQTARWIQELTDDKCVLLPWINSDVALASFSCGIFIDSIRFFLDTLPGVNSILSHMWVFYVTNYAHIQVKDHVLRVIHKNMLQLPWSNFFPSLQDIELMVRVVEHFVPMSHSLLGNVFVSVKWLDVVKYYSSQEEAEILAKLHVYLLHLLVKLPCEPSLKQNNDVVLLLSEARYFSWHLVDSANYDLVLNWFVMSCDPRIVLKDENSEYYKLDSLILQILGICAGFIETPKECHPTTRTKRLMYVKANNKWLMTANTRFKCKDSPLFKSAFVRILDEIEGTLDRCKLMPCEPFLIGISENEKPSELAKLSSELLNIFKEEELTPVLEEAFIDWLGQKRSCTMIYGLLRSIALSAISPSIFGNIADACLGCYFDSNDNFSWSDINDKFITYASGQSGLLKTSLITNGNLLTLYAIILKQSNEMTNLLEEKIIINEILQSITSVKRSEAIEPKLVLMIAHAFKIADTISQLDDEECISILTRLSTYLNNICNDKGNGLLCTLGLRKSETFTNRFKFVCLIGRACIMKLFEARYATEEDKIDKKMFMSLDQAQLNKKYQNMGSYIDTALEEIQKVEKLEDVITLLKSLGFQIFNKNYLI